METRPQIRWRRIGQNEVYAHNYRMAVVASNKGEAIKAIKEIFPDEYDVIELTSNKSDSRHEAVSVQRVQE